MRMFAGGVAVMLALTCSSLSFAVGQTTANEAVTSAKEHAAMKACTSAADVVVWFVPGSKLFFRKGQAGFGKGVGSLVCRHVALAKKGRAAPVPSPAPAEATTASPDAMSSPSVMSSPSMMSSPEATMTAVPQPSPAPSASP